LVADVDFLVTARPGEFLEWHATFGLEPDIDDRKVLLDADDGAFDHRPFHQRVIGKGLGEKGGEIFFLRLSEGQMVLLGDGAPAAGWCSSRTETVLHSGGRSSAVRARDGRV